MSYCEQADLEKTMSAESLIVLTDTEGTDVLNTAVLDRAITDAGSEINYWLADVAEIPLDPVPDVIRRMAVAITTYELAKTSRGGANEDQLRRYNAVIDTLRAVADGVLSVGAIDPTGVLTDADGTDTDVRVSAGTRTFTADTMAGY